jgi:hypothetical protein
VYPYFNFFQSYSFVRIFRLILIEGCQNFQNTNFLRKKEKEKEKTLKGFRSLMEFAKINMPESLNYIYIYIYKTWVF